MAITRSQALELFRSDDLIGLGIEADALRQSLHSEGVVTYTINRTVHYAAFLGGSVLDFDTIYARVAEALEMGATGVSLAGGQQAGIEVPGMEPPGIQFFERLLQGLRQRFAGTCLHCLSAPEILGVARQSALTVRDTLSRLRDAGLDSILGGGSEILGERARRPAGWRDCSMEEWIAVHQAAHEIGMRTTATIIFGRGETFEERVNHLERVLRLQEITGGFAAFLPCDFSLGLSAGGPFIRDPAGVDRPTSVEYLKTLAISRLYLDNIENLELSAEDLDLKVLQLGLRFGCNDAGSAGDGPSGGSRSGEEDLRRVIRDAGFEPVERDSLYTTCFLH